MDELLQASIAVLPYLETSTGVLCVDAVYRTPATQLRDAADRMEAKDAAIERFRQAVDAARKETG